MFYTYQILNILYGFGFSKLSILVKLKSEWLITSGSFGGTHIYTIEIINPRVILIFSLYNDTYFKGSKSNFLNHSCSTIIIVFNIWI